MVHEFCRRRLEEIIVIFQFQPPAVTFCMVILHVVFSLLATVANLLLIHALWKASSITATLKQMFLSLAVSDLAVGLIIHPMTATILGIVLNITIMSGNFDFDRFCPSVLTSVIALTVFLTSASFSTIAAIAVDRHLALTIHQRYQELVTTKRVRIVLVALWFFSALSTFVYIEFPNHNSSVSSSIELVGLLLITVAYFRIYKVVRYHQNQINGQNQIQDGQALHSVRVKKSALNTFYVYIICFFCFTPNLITGILLEASNSQTSTLVAHYHFSFLVLLNSSLNPLVYCWRYREIRNIVKNTVKKIFSSNPIAQ